MSKNDKTIHYLQSITTSWSGYCYLNKGECNLNQSKDDFFAERVAKNISHKVTTYFTS